jgi:glycosyltransferase involved in cell wall biosynthesis
VPRKVVVPTAFDVSGEPAPRSDKQPGSHLTIGYLGRIEQIKGIELLLLAVLEMPVASITLLVAGNGPQLYLEELQQRFSRANIHFLGFTEPAMLFSKIDVLVVPSIWEEPLGRVIFEGFAFGVPAIVARIGGMPEIVEQDVTGYVFEPDDSAALVKLLRTLIAQGLPAERMRAACYEKSLGFGVDDVLRAHMSNWQGAIAQQAGNVASQAGTREAGLRVLAFPKSGENAYLGTLSKKLEAGGATVDNFDFWRAFFGSYDVVHMHWPDTHLRTHSWWRAIGKHARLALLCLVLRARGTRVVWMMHNLKPHEKDHWISTALFPLWFPQFCTHVMALTANGLNSARLLYPSLRRKPAIVVPHGHYREAYPTVPSRAAARKELGLADDRFTFVFFGNIRRYKNVPLLIKTFRQVPGQDVQLVVAGLPVLGMQADDLRALAAGDDRIHLHLTFIPDEKLPLYLGAADQVVLPFDSILNSGSVLLALSFNRTVLAPRLGALPEIEAQVGPRWLQLYDGELTPQLLMQARANAAPAENEQADLSAFDWDAIAAATLDFYRCADSDRSVAGSRPALGESSSR